MKSTPAFSDPNRMGGVLQLAMEEILDHDGAAAVLSLAGIPNEIDNTPPHGQDAEIPSFHVSGMQTALEKIYGPRAGRGLALRIGRACFKYILREFGPELGFTSLAFRLLPLSSRLMKGSNAFAGLFNDLTDQEVRLEENDRYIYWNIQRCSLRSEAGVDGPVCMLAVGLLQEALSWVSAGRYFQVEQKSGLACGDGVCTIVIDRIPMS